MKNIEKIYCDLFDKKEIEVIEYSDKDKKTNQEYRYLLTKKWDKGDKCATVIMYNPSDATALFYDKTVMNVENYLKKKGFNHINIVNLFAIKGKNSSIVSQTNELYEKKNNAFIIAAVKEANEVFLAWGYGKENKSKTIQSRIREVEKLVRSNVTKKDDIRAFADEGKVNIKCHPQNMNIETWSDIPYNFESLEDKED